MPALCEDGTRQPRTGFVRPPERGDRGGGVAEQRAARRQHARRIDEAELGELVDGPPRLGNEREQRGAEPEGTAWPPRSVQSRANRAFAFSRRWAGASWVKEHMVASVERELVAVLSDVATTDRSCSRRSHGNREERAPDRIPRTRHRLVSAGYRLAPVPDRTVVLEVEGEGDAMVGRSCSISTRPCRGTRRCQGGARPGRHRR